MDAWIVAIVAMTTYLVFAFALGILAGRGRSFYSVSEYAVADRGLGLLVMWFLMGGTIFSAFAFLGRPGWAYSKGAASFYILAYAALGLLPWYVIGPKVARLGTQRNYFTIGDLIGDRYQSRTLVVLVGIVSVLAFVQYLTLQIKGMAYVFNVLTDGHIPFWFGALLAYGIVVVYVVTSGVRGAAWSDVLQAILMLVVAWVLGIYLVTTLHGGIGPMFVAIGATRLSHHRRRWIGDVGGGLQFGDRGLDDRFHDVAAPIHEILHHQRATYKIDCHRLSGVRAVSGSGALHRLFRDRCGG